MAKGEGTSSSSKVTPGRDFEAAEEAPFEEPSEAPNEGPSEAPTEELQEAPVEVVEAVEEAAETPAESRDLFVIAKSKEHMLTHSRVQPS